MKMTATSDSEKELSERSNEILLTDFMDGTSARTRPVNYNEIMLRRKEKGDKARQVSSSSGAADSKLAQDSVERASDVPEDNPLISNNSKILDANKNSNDSKKVRSGRKADTNASTNNGSFVQDKDDRSLNPHDKSKDKGGKIVSYKYNRESEEKFEGKNHGSRKKADYGLDKRRDSESYKQDRVSERSRIKSEIVKAQPYNEERQAYRKMKTDKRLGSDSDNEYKKRNMNDGRQTDNLKARGTDKSLKEKKHKHHPEEDKSGSRNNVKKNEREGTDPTRSYPEKSRSKRRRSRSKDRERGRRSPSQSPKVLKHMSKNKMELAEPSSQSTKDKSGREHSNVDNKRISSNGSNSQSRRNANTSSGLGGYSPRKRKTEAAAKTPSPTHRSPERKSAGWDSQNVEKESVVASSTLFNLNAITQKLSLNIMEHPSITTVAPTMVNPIGISLHTLSTQVHAVETIQLTQATRPKRRLYVENLPVSACEKDLIECFNKLLMSSGVNYIQGKQPCISCIIHKEKSQALVEFLTPEDASAALSLDGMFFSGSNLKLRRPKDYANVTTGLSDKSVGSVDSINDIVEDSPNKIFVGGISKLFSSRMLLDIARAFGPVRALHFEFIADANEPCAFLEYVDHSITSKACAGLNGMRLGGQVLTAVLATPEHALENVGKLLTYEIPEHAKPLIKKPGTVLKLKNVFNPEYLVSLSESELEEILEDIRLECSRFGMVRSVNVAKKTSASGTMEVNQMSTNDCTDANGFHFANMSDRVQHVDKSTSGLRGEFERSKLVEPPKQLENCRSLVEKKGYDNIAGLSDVVSGSVEHEDITRSRLIGESLMPGNIVKDETPELPFEGADVPFEETPSQSNPGDAGENGIQQNTSDIELVSNCRNAGSTSVMDYELEHKPSTEDMKSEDHTAKLPSSEEELKPGERNSADVEIDITDRKQLDGPSEGDDRKDVYVEAGHIFEPGSVIVEYRRVEAACMAAHCLHGRTFDGRVVTVEYVDERG